MTVHGRQSGGAPFERRFFLFLERVLLYKYSHGTDFYRKDAQGNIIALLDNSGNIVVRYVYDAWGNHAVLGTDGNDITDPNNIGILNPFRYRGYYYDTETGLYYLKTRYYDPETGRFITIDGIEYLDPETINGLNLYAYCGNNPVMRTDENGSNWWTDFWNSIAGAIVKIVIGVVVIAALGVASVITGGAAAAIFTGAFLGAAMSGISSCVIGLATGQSLTAIANDFLTGVIVGGVSGALSGIGAPTGTAATALGKLGLAAKAAKSMFQYVGFQMGFNMALSGLSYAANVIMNREQASYSKFLISLVSGGIAGWLGSGIKGAVESFILDVVTNRVQRVLDYFGWN